MSKQHTTPDDSGIETTVSQRERFDRLKAEWSDDDLPELSDEQLLKGLMDTVEAVDSGFYTGPTIVDRLQSVLARVRTGTTQLVTDGGRPADGSETQDEAYERVVFAEPYDEMPAKLEVLVGNAGFIVPASRRFPFKDRVLVQFDENKTGRAGGERHWIPEDCLDPEIRTDGGQLLQPRESSGTLAEYVEENREDVEALAETDLPIARFMQRILDRYDRGEL